MRICILCAWRSTNRCTLSSRPPRHVNSTGGGGGWVIANQAGIWAQRMSRNRSPCYGERTFQIFGRYEKNDFPQSEDEGFFVIVHSCPRSTPAYIAMDLAVAATASVLDLETMQRLRESVEYLKQIYLMICCCTSRSARIFPHITTYHLRTVSWLADQKRPKCRGHRPRRPRQNHSGGPVTAAERGGDQRGALHGLHQPGKVCG